MILRTNASTNLHTNDRELLFDDRVKEEQGLLLQLADILYACCYDFRITTGEGNVESAYNIARLSCTLSWLEVYHRDFDSIEYVIQQNVRRSLIYPYIRNWKFSCKVLVDVSKILLLGKSAILQCLLRLRKVCI